MNGRGFDEAKYIAARSDEGIEQECCSCSSITIRLKRNINNWLRRGYTRFECADCKQSSRRLLCLNCAASFEKKNEKKFCSQSCAASYNNRLRGEVVKCENPGCGSLLSSRRRRFCGHRCRVDYGYHIFVSAWLKGDISGTRPDGYSVSNYVRRYLYDKYDSQCSRCGWNTPNPVTGRPILEVEHIDGKCTNNRPENLDLICPNCHSLTTTFRALNVGNGNRYRLLARRLVR